jgi:hypothetical protein
VGAASAVANCLLEHVRGVSSARRAFGCLLHTVEKCKEVRKVKETVFTNVGFVDGFLNNK